MGILVVSWNFPPRRGGAEYLIGNLVAGLRQNRAVFVITAHAPSSRSEEGVFRAPWAGLLVFTLYALWRGASLLSQNREIQVVFGGSALVTPLVLVLARLFGRKAVAQAHGLDLVYRNSLYQALCVRWLKFCDRIVANSAYTASLALKKGVPREHTYVIPPGIHSARFTQEPANVEAIKKEFALQDKRTILFVGRLAKRKGVKEFIEKSLLGIINEVPDACLVIVGDNPTESLAHHGDALGEIAAVISKMDLLTQVRLHGPASDDELVKLYQACDVVILPALAETDDAEGFGIVLLEAAAAGKPSVATRVGGIPDAIEDGKSGILVEPGDYGQLADAVIALLRDGRRRLTMGEYARRRVDERFCWERVIKRYDLALAF
jgi:phosphatidyl-myo-inositol dimannoside synthase